MRPGTAVLVVMGVAGSLGCPDKSGVDPRVDPIPGRSNPGVVYDGGRQRVLVFGGEGAAFRDLWAWDGARWNFLSANGPSPRYDPVMGYDPARRRMVLFGGRGGFGPSAIAHSDTWEWDGTAWFKRDSTGPGPRAHATGTFDAARGVLVLFGGVSPSDQMLRDTWEWNGTTWSRRDTLGPPRTAPNGMVYDPVRGKVQLLTTDFARPAGGQRYASDLWEWDGTSWTLRPGTPPPLSPIQRLTSAGPGGGLILFDGDLSVGATGATWRYDNSAWTKVSSTGPSTRNGAALMYDPRRDVVVLFGGGTNTSNFSDTWEWNGTGWNMVPP